MAATVPEPTQPWEIWLVHHTHVDIGYTEPQDIIMRKHAEFVAQALDYCTATDALPPGERFVWTCEVAWTVKAFLARFPERADEFFRRVREGRIEVTALYLQLTDLFSIELLEETTDHVFRLAGQHDFEVVTAMNDDVNGWTWGLPDMLAERGVRYMDTAINETRALGVRPRPAMFRWIGPRGGSLLFWHSTGYLTGNDLGLDQPGADQRIAEFLKHLEQGGYPLRAIEVRIQGESHDNAPPGLWLSRCVHSWNAARPAGVTVRLVTPRQWFEEVERAWPTDIVEHQAGWPDWWADGNGSAAMETALVRRAQADLNTVRALTAAAGLELPAESVDRAREAAAFFCEHTWGAWCSTDQPDSLTSRAQWNTKAGFANTAAVEARAAVDGLLAAQALRAGGSGPGILVFNPLAWPRSDVVELTVADADIGAADTGWVRASVRSEEGPAFHLVDADTGEVFPVVREPAIVDSARRPGQRVSFVARKVPAGGFRRYRIIAGAAEPDGKSTAVGAKLTSPYVEVTAAKDGTGIASIRDGADGAEWVGGQGYALGEVVYETIPDVLGREKLCGWNGIRRDCTFTRTSLRFNEPRRIETAGGVGMVLQARDLPGSLLSLAMEVMIYDELQRVDVRYRLVKVPTTKAEALYVAFPLIVGERPEVWLDIPGALMRPGVDQVPGTATDWHSVQHAFTVAGADAATVVASPDIPLVQVNGINTGKWQETVQAHNGLVMSWVLNNYWFTNFPAAQGGAFSWRYSLHRTPGGFDRLDSERFARSVRMPLIAQAIGQTSP